MSYQSKREKNSYHDMLGAEGGDIVTWAHGKAISKGNMLVSQIFDGINVCGYGDDLVNGNLKEHKTHTRHLFMTKSINQLCQDYNYDKSADATDALLVDGRNLDFWQIKKKANHCKSADKDIFGNLLNFAKWLKKTTKNRYKIHPHVVFWDCDTVDEAYDKFKNPAAIPVEFKKYIMTREYLCKFLGKDSDTIHDKTYELRKNKKIFDNKILKYAKTIS